MAIQFRRESGYAQALPRCSGSPSPLRYGDIPHMGRFWPVNDAHQCEPMTITVNSKTQFIIQNHSQKALEWEILEAA